MAIPASPIPERTLSPSTKLPRATPRQRRRPRWRTQAYQSEAGDLARSSATLSEDSVGATWAGDTVTFNFATGPTTGVAPVSSAMDSQADAIIEQAMQSWAGVSGITFQQVADSTTADVSFGWGDFE